jgi:hypothetical protein
MQNRASTVGLSEAEPVHFRLALVHLAKRRRLQAAARVRPVVRRRQAALVGPAQREQAPLASVQ